jgi:hypothetical protein
VQGEALDVENDVSSVHYESVRRKFTAFNALFSASRKINKSKIVPAILRQLVRSLLLDFSVIFKA